MHDCGLAKDGYRKALGKTWERFFINDTELGMGYAADAALLVLEAVFLPSTGFPKLAADLPSFRARTSSISRFKPLTRPSFSSGSAFPLQAHLILQLPSIK